MYGLKKNKSSFMWLSVPMTLMLVSLFTANFISRSSEARVGDACGSGRTSSAQIAQSNAFCNSQRSVNCQAELCAPNDPDTPTGARTCVSAGRDPMVECDSCGNGVVGSGETCDGTIFSRGNPTSGTCRAASAPSACTYCGDGIVNGNEECDFGAINGTLATVCAADCTWKLPDHPAPNCGNNSVDRAQESCDGTSYRADLTATGACRSAGSSGECTFCGDHVVQDGLEACDPTAFDTGCASDEVCVEGCQRCVPAVAQCGNSTLDAGETCDYSVSLTNGCGADQICNHACACEDVVPDPQTSGQNGLIFKGCSLNPGKWGYAGLLVLFVPLVYATRRKRL